MDTSEEYIKVIIVHPTVHFSFSFVYAKYLHIASYLYGKQIKSNLGTKLYLLTIFVCVHLNRLGLHECRPRILNKKIVWDISFTLYRVIFLYCLHVVSSNSSAFKFPMELSFP